LSKLAANLPHALRSQAKQCARLGSILYSGLLDRAAAEIEAGNSGICIRLLRDFSLDPPGSALALRFLGAVNRLVLEGNAPDLEPCYSGEILDMDETWSRFTQVLRTNQRELPALIRMPVQTCELARTAALLPGFLEVARQTGLPLRLLEAGAAAGLNLLWDRYFYEASNQAWGDPESPVLIRGSYRHNHPSLRGTAVVVERAGCDEKPLHAESGADRLTLLSFVWPDRQDRVRQMRAALDLAQQVPVTIDADRAEVWIEKQLKRRDSRCATVVFHSLFWDSLAPQAAARFQFVMEEAGKRATSDAPLAWLRMEPGGVEAEVRLRIWPAGNDKLIALAGFYGQWVDAPDAEAGGRGSPVRLS
jgi:hypothetical protein